ncbi:MAG TPA: hypothetical protein VFI73_12140 [Candidatus Nitrosopolaris sp.]|nr:hypothetical protein [Candidatus Nitrosopolaris sp.]
MAYNEHFELTEAKETSCKKDLSPSRLIPDSGSVDRPVVVGQVRIP